MRTNAARAAAVLLTLLAFAGDALAQQRPSTLWRPASPANYRRGRNARINFVIIHTVEGSALGAVSWFQNPRAEVSAHFVVAHSGTIYQCVAESNTAWHAGWINDASIGIEHEGYAGRNTWTDAQYRASAAITRYVCARYGVPRDRQHILGHREVRGATHTDPGPFFNWAYYMRLVNDSNTAPAGTTAREVTPDTAVVRDGPGWGNAIFGTVRQGQIYVATREDSGWFRLFYDNRSGWVWGGSLRRRTNGIGRRYTADAAARDGEGGAQIGAVNRGEVFIANLRQNGWVRIWYRGRQAWTREGATEVLYFP